MNSTRHLPGFLVAVVVPLVLWLSWRFVPYPGSWIAASAAIGGYLGFLLHQHVKVRRGISKSTLAEQVALSVLLMVIFILAL